MPENEEEQTTEEATSDDNSENDPVVRLEKARNAAAKEKTKQDPEEAEEKKPTTKALKLFTAQFIVKPLVTDILTTGGIATFGASWIGLGLYTLIKDLSFGIFGSPLADPADGLFLATPPKALEKIPKSTRHFLRVPARLIIYPGGIIVLCLYLTLLVCVISIGYAVTNPIETISKVFREKIGF